MTKKHYYIYILTNKRNIVLYIGVTDKLAIRVYQHKQKLVKGFTERYNVDKLVYYEIYDRPYEAISREKQLKAGSRQDKINLIVGTNPTFRDLYDEIAG